MGIKPENIKVALLAGGRSSERVISLTSGKGAAQALNEAGFSVQVLDPADTDDLVALVRGKFDVAFLCLHGKGGEDGAIQGMLEVLGIPYIGAGIWASATAMDKAKAKECYLKARIMTPISCVLTSEKDLNIAHLSATIGSKVVVKPVAGGSTLGIYLCEGDAEITTAVHEAFKFDSEVLVESFVSGTELTVAVIGNDSPQALPVIQIVPQLGEFYDYESKYAPGGSKHLCPAPLTDAQTAHVQEVAIAAHKALECRGVSRTDIILDKDDVAWVLETNTIPGMTATSLLPDAGKAAGIDFPQLCTKLIELALEA